VAEFMYESIVFCSACTMYYQSWFSISSPDEFLVSISLILVHNQGWKKTSF